MQPVKRRTVMARAAALPWLVACPTLPAPAGAATQTLLRLRLDLRGERAAGRLDPARDVVGVRGAVAPLSWDLTLPARATAVPGVYEIELRFDTAPPAAGVPYKFKIDRPGAARDDGWEPGHNRVLRPPAQAGAWVERAWGDDPDRGPPRRTGRIERIAPLASAHVAAREVQVWLPPGYEAEPGRRYPVLYLHDGENVFDHLGAGAEWSVDETAERLVHAGAIEPCIVVAVSHAGTRMLDYTPWAARSGWLHALPGGEGGGAVAYGRYLAEELKPLIDHRYRTRPGREHTAVGGSSLGGLVSMWLVLERGATFGAALVVSPSVWWANGRIVGAVAKAPAATPAPRLWIDVGSGEGAGMVQGARALRDAVRARGWNTAYLEAEGAGHDETAWAARVEGMLRFLYATVPMR